MSNITIRGYCDTPSVAPGEVITFHVSSDLPGQYEAKLVRLIHGDTNPRGPGFKEILLDSTIDGTYPATNQRTQSGGFIEISDPSASLAPDGDFGVQLFLWSTTPSKHRQGVLARWTDDDHRGWALTVDDGHLTFTVGDGTQQSSVRSDMPLFAEAWYAVTASFDATRSVLSLRQSPVVNRVNSIFGPVFPIKSSFAGEVHDAAPPAPAEAPVLIAGLAESAPDHGRTWVKDHFNGKVDSPRIFGRILTESDHSSLIDDRPSSGALLAHWSFAEGIGIGGIPTDRVGDVSGHGRHGRCVNQPDRAMTGWNWKGKEENFVHAPEEYGAIWFHEDSLDDCRWKPAFSLTIPEELRSGVYAVKVSQLGGEDYIPFFVTPARGTATAKILLLFPTCSYMAYANGQIMQNADAGQAVAGHVPVLDERDIELHERYKEYGLSTYDYHVDGRGVGYSTWRRPILNMRPTHRQEFGSLWQFPADLHLVDWLETHGYDYDVATDHDLCREGADLLGRYNVVMTGSHAEYSTWEMEDAWEDYLSAGGRGMYLGSNALYWIISMHPEKPWLLEVRKGETGAKAWQARPGELYHSTSGERGGLWRNRARAPQKIWGTGFTSFGFDHSGYFVPMPDSKDAEVSWIFEGFAEDERIGDFGLVGGGAAGYELDRYDLSLGTPPNTRLLASSYGHSENYTVVPEDMMFPHPGLNGGESSLVRADITYFSTANGGAMFSSSSISWLGSLSWNDHENNVSQMMHNVLRQFEKDEPAPTV
ncbi:N,N-dimethylformamidase [Rhodococcus sp. 27YEA15]|uniref:N,N-dimethylformamidase beta subunit family domain-containing protein n=1 Tax=Rhodococcus sp. 27YEA15 TaxID=3156259 RepID=UPI003C7B2590